MRNRLITLGKMLSVAFCALSMSGLLYSCSDDYDLPDKTPSWLGSSIYYYLQHPKDGRTYTNTVNLIDDLKYSEVLETTGSKTLFVADDAAYDRFFANNTWGVKCYKDLTQSQKKLLLNSCMLDNAYLLEMLPNSTRSSRDANTGLFVDQNVCLKSPTSMGVTDSIAFIPWNDSAIPTYANNDPDYWTRFRQADKGGIYLASDGTLPYMSHWINGHLTQQKITDADFATIMGKTREPNDVYIYTAKVVTPDITCQNGYIDVLDEVVSVPTTMAEMIRTNGKTNLFAHMLDRFSAPFYNANLTNSYRQLNPAADSVFEKRYFSVWSQGDKKFFYAPDDKSKSNPLPELSYDPGWNAYYPLSMSAAAGRAQDMATMFAPTDEALFRYFAEGAGAFLMERYAKKLPVTVENIQENTDQIPLSVIRSLINNNMKASFLGSVPSKYLEIRNDASDAMFGDYKTEEEYKQLIDTSLVASNGVVYILNTVVAPADYACVAAPCLVNDSTRIFNWGIHADDKYMDQPTAALMKAYMSVFLKSMNSTLTLFAPVDRTFEKYYDPVAMTKVTPYVMNFQYSSEQDNLIARAYKYNKETWEVAENPLTLAISSKEIYNRFAREIMNAHVIVHDTDVDPLGLQEDKEYYLSRDGSPIRVIGFKDDIRETGNGTFQIQGGWQTQQGQYINVLKTYNQTREKNGYGNGMCYLVDGLIQHTTNSVYSILNDNDNPDSPYKEFMDLCMIDTDVLERAGFGGTATSATELSRIMEHYEIFQSAQGASVDKAFFYALDQNVRFFSCFNYTVFVPTNDAIKAAKEAGLPSWEEIAAYLDEQEKYVNEHESDPTFDVDSAIVAYKAKAKAMAMAIINLIKYHFMDNSVFADKCPQAETTNETACVNEITNRYYTIKVMSEGNGTLQVTDNNGTTVSINPERKNILACDRWFSGADGDGVSNKNELKELAGSSFSVIHQIDKVLNFKELTNNRYDSDWKDASAAKAYLAKYGLK